MKLQCRVICRVIWQVYYIFEYSVRLPSEFMNHSPRHLQEILCWFSIKKYKAPALVMSS